MGETKQLIPTIIKEILICNDQMSTCLQEISSLYKLWVSFSSNNSEGIQTNYVTTREIKHFGKAVMQRCERLLHISKWGLWAMLNYCGLNCIFFLSSPK